MTDLILEKILVAVDFSAHSNIAVEQAILFAEKSTDAQIVLLWVDTTHQHDSVAIQLDSTDTQAIDAAHHDATSEARVKLEILADHIKSRDIAAVTRMEAGYADEAIVRVAEDIGAAAVVVGTRGLTGFKRFLLGSVAEKVVRLSPTNVLVARGEPRSFTRILVATDFSPASEHALQVAVALSSDEAHLDLVHAWQYPPGVRGASTPDPKDGPLVAIRDDLVGRIDRLGAIMVKRYSTGDHTVEFSRVFGPPASVIHQRLESNMYDLVAMGTHGHRGFRRFLLGSVAAATVRHAPCSVLVTRDLSPH